MNTSSITAPEVLDVTGAAAFLGVSEWTVRDQARQRILPGKKVGKEWRFSRARLLAWLADESLPLTVQARDAVQRGRYQFDTGQFILAGTYQPRLANGGGPEETHKPTPNGQTASRVVA